jgi:DNA repair photolyase
MKLEFREYRARKMVNVHRHVDGPWFWDKYSANPYVGCRSGCEFCYLRGGRYLGRRDPDSFDSLIRIKTNAVELLRKELARLPLEVISCGDWQQPAETRCRLSRGMLEVVNELHFPLLIVERSPLLTRDLDLLAEINRKAWVGVLLSISSLDPVLKRAFEPRSPGVRLRLQAMAQLADAGILVGTALMPVLPFAGDDRAHLEDVVSATIDHGGSFVLAGGLTMSGVQAGRTLEALRRFAPELENRWRDLYGWDMGAQPNYSPLRAYAARLGLLIRELCARRGLMDRMPRHIPPGPLAANKRIAELLFLKSYDFDLEGAQEYRIWTYRKAAWAVDEWPESIVRVHQARGEAGLRELPGIGKSVAAEIAGWLSDEPLEH